MQDTVSSMSRQGRCRARRSASHYSNTNGSEEQSSEISEEEDVCLSVHEWGIDGIITNPTSYLKVRYHHTDQGARVPRPLVLVFVTSESGLAISASTYLLPLYLSGWSFAGGISYFV